MSARALLVVLVALGLTMAVVLGLSQVDDATLDEPPAREGFDVAAARAGLAGAPGPLAALHRQAGDLLPGGRAAYDARLRELRGYPVVVNVWAAWCGPCREELPWFQRQSFERGREVAFLGVDLRDDADAARALMAEIPVAYPSYEDPDGRIYDGFSTKGVPSTIFYDARGRRVSIHQGAYRSQADFVADLERYAR